MTIQLIIDNVVIPVKHLTFSDGASTLKLDIPKDFTPSRYVSISVNTTTPCDKVLVEILQAASACCECFGGNFNPKWFIYLPYLPYARGDRVFETGNPHPLRTFLATLCTMAEECTIHTTDPHSGYYKEFESSDISFIVKPQEDCFIETIGRQVKSGSVLIAPDKGSLNKIYKIQNSLSLRSTEVEVVEAGKKRDLETGRVVETTLPDTFDFKGKVCYIADDLGDYNNTFVGLAKKLKEAGAKEVHLYVTHMIAAGGLENLVGIVDKLHVYQVVSTYITMEDVRNFNEGKEVRKFSR